MLGTFTVLGLNLIKDKKYKSIEDTQNYFHNLESTIAEFELEFEFNKDTENINIIDSYTCYSMKIIPEIIIKNENTSKYYILKFLSKTYIKF